MPQRKLFFDKLIVGHECTFHITPQNQNQITGCKVIIKKLSGQTTDDKRQMHNWKLYRYFHKEFHSKYSLLTYFVLNILITYVYQKNKIKRKRVYYTLCDTENQKMQEKP